MDTMTIGEACATLELSPHAFRLLLAEYVDLLPSARGAEGPPAELTSDDVAVLRQIAAAQAEGVGHAEIRQRLAAGAAADGGADEAPTAVTLEHIRQQLADMDGRWLRDRERLFTALLRMQQEIQHLRYELAAHSSRRDRKR